MDEPEPVPNGNLESQEPSVLSAQEAMSLISPDSASSLLSPPDATPGAPDSEQAGSAATDRGEPSSSDDTGTSQT